MAKAVEAGDRFGSLVVLNLIKGSKHKHPSARCECDCGTVTTHRLTRLRTGKSVRCRECGSSQAWSNRNRPAIEHMAVRRRIESYRDNARRKGIEFGIFSFELAALFHSPCHYCGDEPSSHQRAKGSIGGVLLNGVDRVDNSKGYVSGNVVSCCSSCNFAKRGMTAAEFIAWARRVVAHCEGRDQ